MLPCLFSLTGSETTPSGCKIVSVGANVVLTTFNSLLFVNNDVGLGLKVVRAVLFCNKSQYKLFFSSEQLPSTHS